MADSFGYATGKLKDFDRLLKVATEGLSPEEIVRKHAAHARAAHAEVLAQQRRRSGMTPAFARAVDGRLGAPEESVRPGGLIVYDYDYGPEIATYALEFCRARSPVLSGAYKKAWFVMADGKVVAPEDVPPFAELIVTNDRPYHRKIETGAMKMRVPPGIVEDARQAVNRRYGNTVKASLRFITLQGGYVLKGHGVRVNKKTGKRTTRSDVKPGDPLTYPALVIERR